MVVAEIGTYDGVTSCAVAPIVKAMNGNFIAVDWFHGSIKVNPNEQGYSSNKHSELLIQFKENIDIVECTDITKIYDMSSLEAASNIEDKSLDICFIDADHRYEEVKKDILAYFPKIKPGGILCGHDLEQHFLYRFNTFTPQELEEDFYNGCHPGVIQAIGELIGLDIVKQYSDNVWAVMVQ